MNMINVPKGLGRIYLIILWVITWFLKKEKNINVKLFILFWIFSI